MQTLEVKAPYIPKITIEERRLSLLLAKDGEMICAYCPELDLVSELDTFEEVIEDVIEAIKEYAEEYTENFELYSNSPNRGHHLPYIKAVTSCKTDWDIKKLLEIKIWQHIHLTNLERF